MICLAGFILILTGCGLTFSYGVYQALYEAMAKTPSTPFTGASSAEIDLIGTLAISLMTMLGPFVSAGCKLYHPRYIVIGGAFVFSMGLFLASVSEKTWQFMITQGIIVGIGTSMVFIPAVTVSPTWFDKRRGLALGVIVSGTGIGGVIWAPTIRAMNAAVGFRNALRITAAISLMLLSAGGYAMDWEPGYRRTISISTSRRRRFRLFDIPLVNWRIARSRKFLVQAVGAVLQSAAYAVPLFFYASYATALGYSESTSASFIAISNAANFIGKIAIGYAADRLGRLNILFATTLISAVSVLGFWLPSVLATDGRAQRGLFIAFTILYGAFASAYTSLFPASIIDLFGVQNFASVNGALYMIRGMATLVGTPTAGLMIPRSEALTSPSKYQDTAVMVGVLYIAATLAAAWVRIEMRTEGSWKWKA
jgi:MFS family permease